MASSCRCLVWIDLCSLLHDSCNTWQACIPLVDVLLASLHHSVSQTPKSMEQGSTPALCKHLAESLSTQQTPGMPYKGHKGLFSVKLRKSKAGAPFWGDLSIGLSSCCICSTMQLCALSCCDCTRCLTLCSTHQVKVPKSGTEQIRLKVISMIVVVHIGTCSVTQNNE